MKDKKKVNTTNFNGVLTQKAKNSKPIRVLYKKVGKVPEVKIINNIFRLKKAIVRKKFDIIPYETLYIVCPNKKRAKGNPINIILDFRHIAGNFLLVGIDKKTREFQSLSQEDINWFIEDLMNRSPIKKQDRETFFKTEFKQNIHERYYEEKNSSQYNFENRLIKTLTNIELAIENLAISKRKKRKI